MLTETQRAELRVDLEALLAHFRELLQDQSGLAGTVELDQARMGRLSRIDAIQQQKMAEANLARHKLRLERIEAALERLEDEPDEYGECPDCGEDIAFKRLKASPDAIFCVPCADERAKARARRRR